LFQLLNDKVVEGTVRTPTFSAVSDTELSYTVQLFSIVHIGVSRREERGEFLDGKGNGITGTAFFQECPETQIIVQTS